jgi:hypothetical protein
LWEIVVSQGQNVESVTRRTVNMPRMSRLPDNTRLESLLSPRPLRLRRSGWQRKKCESVAGAAIFDFGFEGRQRILK